MVATIAYAEPVAAEEAVSHVKAMIAELAILCVGAGRHDAAIELLRVLLLLQRPLMAQPLEANAAPGDAA